MLAGNLLVAAIATLAGLVGAAPGTSDDASNLLVRGTPAQCPAGMTYVGFKQKCKCDDDGRVYGDRDEDFYDKAQKHCCPKPHAKLKCRPGQKQFCVLNVNTYAQYDEHAELCRDDGITFTFCSRPEDIHKRLAVECFRDKDCPGPTLAEHCCMCPKGKVWHDGLCRWKPLEKPKCKGKQVAYCAIDGKQFIKYDAWHPSCADNGLHITFCSNDKPGEPEKKCKWKWEKGEKWGEGGKACRARVAAPPPKKPAY